MSWSALIMSYLSFEPLFPFWESFMWNSVKRGLSRAREGNQATCFASCLLPKKRVTNKETVGSHPLPFTARRRLKTPFLLLQRCSWPSGCRASSQQYTTRWLRALTTPSRGPPWAGLSSWGRSTSSVHSSMPSGCPRGSSPASATSG